MGRVVDAESGLIYLRARYYDPATGQMLSRDPLVATTREPYSYVGDNPLNGTDPLGLCWGPSCWVQSVEQTVENAGQDVQNAVGNAGQAVVNATTGAASWVNKNIQFSVGVCPVFGCVGVSYQNGHVSISGGVGLVYAWPGASASYNPNGPPPCGGSQSNTIGVNTPFGGGGYSWPGNDISQGGSWSGGEGPSKVTGWGGGYVHNWTYTW